MTASPYPDWIDKVLRGDPDTDEDLVSFISGGKRLREVLEERLAEAEAELERRRTRRKPLNGRTILDALQEAPPVRESGARPVKQTIPSKDFLPKVPARDSILWGVLRVLYTNPGGVELKPLAQRLERLRVYKNKVEDATRSTATNLNILKKMGWEFSKPRHGVWALAAWPASVRPPDPWPEAVMH